LKVIDKRDRVIGNIVLNLPDRQIRSYWVILLGVFIFSISMLYIKITLYEKGYVTSDCAYYANLFWNTAKGDFFYSDFVSERYGGTNYLDDHFSPTLIIVSIIYKIFKTPKSLVVIQSITPSITAMFLFLCIRKNKTLSNLILIIFIISYLFFEMNITATVDSIYGFHHDCIIPVFVVISYYAYLEKNFLIFLLSIFFLCGLKEDLPIILLFLSLIHIVASKILKKWAVKKFIYGILIISLFFIFSGIVVYPYFFRGEFGTFHSGVFFDLKNLSFQDFDQRWIKLFCFSSSIFAPDILILGVPLLAIFSIKSISPGDWHSFVLIILTVIAAFEGYRRTKTLRKPSLVSLRQVFFLATMLFLVFSIQKGGEYIVNEIMYVRSLPYLGEYENLDKISGKIPENAILKTTADLQVRFANRKHLTWDIEKAEYLVANDLTKFPTRRYYGWQEEFKMLEKVKRGGDFILIANVGTFNLYQRIKKSTG